MRNSIVVTIAVVMLAMILSFVSCERSGRRGDGVTSRFGTGETGSGLDENSSSAGSNALRTLSIEQAIADAREYTPAGELANNAQFDPLVFEMLRAEFIRQIEERYCNPVERPVMDASWESGYVPKTGHCTGLDGENGYVPKTGHCTDMAGGVDSIAGRSTEVNYRITSAAPMGDAGRVTDLTYDDTGRLNWTYVNVGDYDSSGEVGIPDITMIAQYYLAKTNDGIGDDALESWIDGDKSGEVGISDITPIAQGYLNTVMGYRIFTSSQPDSGFTVVGPVVEFGDAGVFPKTFSVLLPVGVQQYVAVAPVDGDGAQGERSAGIPIAIQTGEPDILQVSPIICFEGVEFDISAVVNGLLPIYYSWDFGANFTPQTSSDSSPLVTCDSTGEFDCSLTVANSLGADTLDFTISSSLPNTPPTIKWVTPQGGDSGNAVKFSAGIDGSLPMTYNWNFGGGAMPNVSSLESPTVILGADNTYNASLMVSNAYGSDTYNFELTVPYSTHIFDDMPDDSIFLFTPVPSVKLGESVYVFVCAKVTESNPMANLDRARILVENSMLLAIGSGCLTQSETNPLFSNLYAEEMASDIESNGAYLYSNLAQYDAWAGFGDQSGIALLSVPVFPQKSSVDVGVNWGNNTLTTTGDGIACAVKFRSLSKGTAVLEIQGRDYENIVRTAYTDLEKNEFEFANIGPAIQIVVE